MSNIDGLDHIGIRGSDFLRSIAFYRVFGFELLRSDLNERVLALVHNQGISKTGVEK